MKLYKLTIAIILNFLYLGSLCGQEVFPREDINHLKKSIRIICELNKNELFTSFSEENLLLIRLNPTSRGIRHKLEDGEIKKVENPLIKGSWEIKQILKNKTNLRREESTYQWSPSKQRSHIKRTYDPFKHGGLVLTYYYPSNSGKSKFRPILLVPETWEQYIEEFYKHISEEREFENRPERDLKTILSIDNPLISFYSFRELLKRESISKETYKKYIQNSKGILFSNIIVQTLRNSTYPRVLIKHIKLRIEEGKKKDINHIILAIYSYKRCFSLLNNGEDNFTDNIYQFLKKKLLNKHNKYFEDNKIMKRIFKKIKPINSTK